MNLYPLKMVPIFKDYIWGGSKLREIYGKDTPYDITAESWEVSTHKDGVSRVGNGEYSGKGLNEVAEILGGQLLGSLCGTKRFPLLLKLIDASRRLSVQVHPDDAYAFLHENGELGKTEMWLVLHAEPGAKLIYGFKNDVTKAEFEKAIKDNSLEDILNYVDVNTGDCFFISSGTVHAICEGLLIAEIQQNSNTTYRVYDWGRVGADGKPRPLHIEKALDVSNLKASAGKEKSRGLVIENDGIKRTMLACSVYFASEYVLSKRTASEATDGRSFHIILFTDGKGTLAYDGGKVNFKNGDSFVIPAGMGEYTIEGHCAYMKNYLPEFEKDFLKPLLNAGYKQEEIKELLK